MSLGFLAHTFTAGEAARITGMEPVRQRDLRHRGFLPSHDANARFDVFDLAQMYFIQAMSVRGVGPRTSAPLSEVCATTIGFHALDDPSAFAGDAERLIEAGIVPSEPKWGNAETELRDLLLKKLADRGRDVATLADAMTEENAARQSQASYCARYVTRVLRGKVQPASQFILWADGTETWAKDVQNAMDDMSEDDPRLIGPIIVLPLDLIGSELRRRAKQPFFDIRLGGVYAKRIAP